MPNRDGPRGFTPRFHLTGGEIRPERVRLTAANALIGVGDPLVLTNDGRMDRAAAGNAVAAVAAAPAAASSAAEIPAYVDPNIVYSAQTDNGTGVATAETAINTNINFVIGNAVNGRSIAELDQDSAAAGGGSETLPFKVRGLFQSPDNEFGEFNELLVTINNSPFKGGTGTAGV